MDLQIIKQALEVNWRNLAIGHEILEWDNATLVRNTRLPQVYDANFVFNVTASERTAIDRLLTEIGREYADGAPISIRVGPFTPPPFEARIALEDYERTDGIVLLLCGDVRRPAPRVDIRGITSDECWSAFAKLKDADWKEYAAHAKPDSTDLPIAPAFVTAARLKCPPVHYVMAYVDGCAAGYCSAWEGLDGVGQIEDLYVAPAFRHRGIATAMLHECVSIARSQGAGPVVIVVHQANTAKQMYVAMGWQPIATCRQYTKLRSSEVES